MPLGQGRRCLERLVAFAGRGALESTGDESIKRLLGR